MNFIVYNHQMNYKNYFSLGLITLYNFLFAYKYIAEQTSLGLVFTIVYILLFLGAFYITNRINFKWFDSKVFYYGLLITCSLMFLLLFRYVKVESLNVDRWSVINVFWEHVFAGKYPYSVQSNMGNYPGPLPVYFLLALPFYLIGEIGIFSITGFLLLALFMRRNLTPHKSAVCLILIILSIPILWEISVRSTIVVNAVLFILYTSWLLDLDMNKKKNFLLSAILGGLVLSTRSILVLVFVVYGMYMLRNRLLLFPKLMLWGSIVLFVLVLTILPFILVYPNEFLKMNPLFVQTEHLLPLWFSLIFIVFAIIAGWYCKNKHNLYFAVGVVYAFFFACYAGFNCFEYGFTQAYFGSIIDLSYGLFGFVFLLLAVFKQSSAIAVNVK